MNKLFRLVVFEILFFLCLSNIYAFDANLQVDKNKTDINDYIKLRVEINSDEGGQIAVKEIKGLENFEILNQSQSQSSASNVVIIDGKTETKTESKINLDLTLKAKVKGDFEIGPAILNDGSGEINTNTVKVSVTGDNLFVNNNHLNVNTQNNNGNQQVQNNGKQNKDYIGDYEKVDKKNFDDDKSLYLLLGVISIITIFIYITLKKNPEIIEKLLIKNNDNNEEINNKHNEIDNTKNEDNNSIKSDNDNKFFKGEIKNIETQKINNDLIYPDIIEENFISNINNVFKQKLSQKYNIGNIENKTFEEVLGYINDENKLNIQEIISLLNKAKYSNQSGDNEKILELVKEI